MRGFTMACLKDVGTTSDERDKLNSLTRYGRRTVTHLFSSSVGNGSRSQVAFLDPWMIFISSSTVTGSNSERL